ncbi:hypothetical protein [Pyxidicoccus sp. MSG2]|uniref:hypothetical protein n=1 Tax=Pyxidicoccus sp. MSG2 TaxID=2996790 RepID=UPI00226F1FE4|nr:hypothetical protein [Pyxidicoccus sp. MSG2]MCY1021357.1 hypothetical protein [Pyxidicoccus sp. MSG2]
MSGKTEGQDPTVPKRVPIERMAEQASPLVLKRGPAERMAEQLYGPTGLVRARRRPDPPRLASGSKPYGQQIERPSASLRDAPSVREALHSEDSQADAIEERAEELVRAGHLEGRLEQSREEAVGRLEDAYAARSPHLALWLEACGRLKAAGAAHIVEEVLTASDGSLDEVLVEAIDAAPMVIRSSEHPERAQRVSARLETLAEQSLGPEPFIAARALMGAALLVGPAFWPRLHPRFTRWPSTQLDLTLRTVCRQLGAVRPLGARGQLPEAAQLRQAALKLEARLRAEDSEDARYTRYELVVLLGWLWPAAPLEETVGLLHEVYTRNEPIVRVGAISAARTLCIEQSVAISMLAAAPQGSKLLQAAMAFREPGRSA